MTSIKINPEDMKNISGLSNKEWKEILTILSIKFAGIVLGLLVAWSIYKLILFKST